MSEFFYTPITSVSKILRTLISSFNNMSGFELSKKCGVPVSTINRILAGAVIDPKISTLKPIADYFGLTVDQLLGYSALPDNFNTNKKMLPTIALPILDQTNFNNHNAKICQWFTWVTEKPVQKDNAVAISISTEEFEPIFAKDSILIVETSLTTPQDDDYVAIVFDNSNEISIKKYKIADNEHYLVPLNPQLRAILCSEKKYQLLGVITEAHTKLRD